LYKNTRTHTSTMSLSFIAFTYLNLWWVSLFLCWPFCVEAKAEGEKNDNALDYTSSPKTIHWKKMLILTSSVSAVITALIAVVIHFIK
jgi:predicted secreted protein